MRSHDSVSHSAQPLQVRQFYQEHYSANLCKLVVLGRESLDELQQMVQELFSAVENRHLPVPSFSGELLVQMGSKLPLQFDGKLVVQICLGTLQFCLAVCSWQVAISVWG